jgi:hypothetical protein
MFNTIKMLINTNNMHFESLKNGMKDAEQRFLNNEYSLRAFIDILSHRAVVGSAPIINHKKLFFKYIYDFCKRNGIETTMLIEEIRLYLAREINGEIYLNEIK